MKYADCLVMTSEYEALPMTLNEALIVGTPVITTNHISAKEIVENRVDGLISDNNVEELVKCVSQILNNKNFLEKLKLNAKNKNINKNLAINQFINLLKFY